MANEVHAKWLLEGVQKWNRRRKKVDFCPELSGINFFDFLPQDYRDSPRTSRYFEKIDLSYADLSNANLSGLNFFGSKFIDANLSNANMKLSNFEKANFTRADLSSADAQMSSFLMSIFNETLVKNVNFKNAIVDSFISIDEIMQSGETLTVLSSDELASRIDVLDEIGTLGQITGPAEGKQAPENINNKIIKTKKNKYDVFFATIREPIYQRGEIIDFGFNNNNKISYGVCEVIVPDGHRIGSLGSPMWKRLLNRRDDRLAVENLISLNDNLFWKFIKDTTIKMKIRENSTIFIHGFNTSFEQSVIRAAQIGFDLGIGQGIGLFSWPSKGTLLKYSADEASVDASKYFLADFIENFTINCPNQKINLIAHSMGCRCLVGALEVLSGRRTTILKKINQVILAAADIDTASMMHQGTPIIKYCGRMTSYACELDDALKISTWLHSFPRVGTSPPTFILKGMDTIVVNDAELGIFSHGYIASSRIVLNDIFSLLKYNLSPKDRHAVEAVTEGSEIYWKIKN